jgi:uncharacterized protein (DUF111 family)
MVQVDDAPGELLGEVLRSLADMGAKNIQLLSSLAKKGRPGYVLMIDILAEQETEVAALLAGELGVWGYRVLHSDHKHFGIERHETLLEIAMGEGIERFPIRLKRILNDGQFLRVKAEHDEMSGICAALRAKGHRTSIAVLKARVETAAGSSVPGETLCIALD